MTIIDLQDFRLPGQIPMNLLRGVAYRCVIINHQGDSYCAKKVCTADDTLTYGEVVREGENLFYLCSSVNEPMLRSVKFDRVVPVSERMPQLPELLLRAFSELSARPRGSESDDDDERSSEILRKLMREQEEHAEHLRQLEQSEREKRERQYLREHQRIQEVRQRRQQRRQLHREFWDSAQGIECRRDIRRTLARKEL